jgi:hypothetical protein
MNKRSNGNPFGMFDVNNFKKWMEDQQDAKSKPNMVGLQVESKIPVKKLLSRIEIQEGDIEEVAKDFKRNGGKISEVNGHNFMIEVSSGTFIIHRMHIQKD